MAASPPLERQVAASLRRAGLSGTDATIVVACSGGPDSTALLHSLNRLRTDHGLALHVAHLNHDFRGAEADHDAAFVQRLANGLGLPCSTDKQDPIEYQRARRVASFEQAAREMRYSFLAAVAASNGATAVALGHTSDDQAETVLQHVLRGSGLAGLRGMAEVSDWPWPATGPAPRLFRPLLGLSKAETAAYCRESGRTFREDSGNYLWRFTRNRVRLDLMPRLARDYNPRVRDALLRLSKAAEADAAYIEGQLEQVWGGLAVAEETAVRLNAAAMRGLHPALQRRALRRAYTVATGDVRGLAEVHVDTMMSLLVARRGGRSVDLPHGIVARLEGGVLSVGSRSAPRPGRPLIGEVNVSVPAIGETIKAEIDGWRLSLRSAAGPTRDDYATKPDRQFAVGLHRDSVGESVTVRGRRPGDRFQPSGMSGTKKLQDFFTDAKIPRSQRDNIPLLVAERGIAWVAGHRVADWAQAVEGEPTVWVSLSTGADVSSGI